MAFLMTALGGGSPAAVPVTLIADLFIDMHGQTPGASVTNTVLNNGSRPASGYGTWVAPASNMTVQANQIARTFNISQAGTIYPAGTTDLSIAYDCSTANIIANINNLTPSRKKIMWSSYVFCGPPATGGSLGYFDISVLSTGSSHYAAAQLTTGSSTGGGSGYRIRVESNINFSTTHSTNIALTPGTMYFMELLNDQFAGVAALAVYDCTASRTLLGLVSTPCYAGNNINDFRFGQNETSTAAANIYFQSQCLSWTQDVFPFQP